MEKNCNGFCTEIIDVWEKQLIVRHLFHAKIIIMSEQINQEKTN